MTRIGGRAIARASRLLSTSNRATASRYAWVEDWEGNGFCVALVEATSARAANGVSNTVSYLIHTHHHADHAGASSLFDKNAARIGDEERRRLLLRDDDPARLAPDETFQDRRTWEIGGERIELAWMPSYTS